VIDETHDAHSTTQSVKIGKYLKSYTLSLKNMKKIRSVIIFSLFFFSSFLVVEAAKAEPSCGGDPSGWEDGEVRECLTLGECGQKNEYAFIVADTTCGSKICCSYFDTEPTANTTSGTVAPPPAVPSAPVPGAEGGTINIGSQYAGQVRPENESDGTYYEQPAGGILIDCARKDPRSGGYCTDTNYLLLQLIEIGKFLFKIIGALAFFFFIYGGLSFILSMGNAEKAKKAHGILLAAVIGLLIAFSAYILIGFVLDALNVAPEFRGV
jgi:hypothetical protein